MIEKSEYLGRIDRLAARMREAGLDGVLLTGESNIDYFSGFRHHAPWTLFARPFFQVISADGRSALLAHTFLEPEMRRTAAVTDIRTTSSSGPAPVQQVKELLQDLGMLSGKLGMELGYEQRLGISVHDFEALQQALAGIEIADASMLLWQSRMIKSRAEIELMRQSAAVTSAAFAAAFEAATPGMSEADIGRICGETMIAQGAERPGFILITSGPGNYHVLSGKPTARKLQQGDMLWMDMGAVVNGYWSDFCRAAYFGKRAAELDAYQARVLEANDAMIAATRPGVPVQKVAEAAVREFKKHGIEVHLGSGRIGHGMGLMSTEPPHVALYEQTLCEPGLVFTIEPRITNDKGVFNCEELLVVTPTGAEVLTTAPRDITYIH
ncbi:MAG TPA: Xaa-Pro peptidase family protein [Burkholderiales bacterium]|nr:Xaa-Pro peptidase family protein [Burkholderiales bacterium]